MKYIKNIEVFESRVISRRPMPIGDFLFDKFFAFSQGKIEDKLQNKGYHEQELYVVDIAIRKNFNKFRIESLSEFLIYIESFVQYKSIHVGFWLGDKVVNSNNFSFQSSLKSEEDYIKMKNFIDTGIILIKKKNTIFEGRFNIDIHLSFIPSKIEELKQTQDYIDWWNSIKDKYEDFQIKKMAKKYNL